MLLTENGQNSLVGWDGEGLKENKAKYTLAQIPGVRETRET